MSSMPLPAAMLQPPRMAAPPLALLQELLQVLRLLQPWLSSAQGRLALQHVLRPLHHARRPPLERPLCTACTHLLPPAGRCAWPARKAVLRQRVDRQMPPRLVPASLPARQSGARC